MSEPQDPPGSGDEVGSLAEEATRLLGALTDWARESGPTGGAASAAASGAAGAAASAAAGLGQGLEEHLATGAPECTWCPVCRGVHVVRQLSPEVREHLASAASSLIQAAAGILATAVPEQSPADPAGRPGGGPGRPERDARSGGPAGVERIDLDADGTDRSGTHFGWPEEDA